MRSTGRDQRWREWGVEVAVLGVHSLISVQLSAAVLDPHRDPLGAINLYARKVDTFTAADLERVMVFAAHAGDALATSRLVSGLTEAIESRHLIGIAQGILMARYQLDEPQAFEALQRYSSHSNVKLREVAAQVIEGGGELPAGSGDVVAQS